MASMECVKADDAVECHLFPLNEGVRSTEQLSRLHSEIVAFADALAIGYIWHKDPLAFHLRLRSNGVSLSEQQPDLPSHIYGVCFYGDNVEDEWFVVYIIRELTRKFTDFAAKINDSDGEFLLVEAANSLPSWAEPTNSANRVFYHNGSLLLIPPDDDHNEGGLPLEAALNKIIKGKSDCSAPNEIVQDISLRIDRYPEKIDESFHRMTVFTPVGVAALLKEEPGLVSAVVHAFCTRDPIDMKACRAMKYFPPENRVNTHVTFTKCLYAMLMHNTFYPDRKTGWNLPLPNSPQYKSHSLGVKLACGFEILVSQAKPSEDLDSNKAWQAYVNGLKKRNYFQNLLEHSQQYNILMNNAKEFFINNLLSLKLNPIMGTKILNMLNTLSIDEKNFRENEAYLPKDDDDDWLSIDPKELENMLQNRYGRKNFTSVNNDTDASKFTGKMTEFLESVSGIDGVEFPDCTNNASQSDDKMPIRPKRGIKTMKKNSQNANDRSKSPSPSRKYGMDFDAEQFSAAVKNMLDLVIPEDKWNSDSESDMSDYETDEDISSNMYKMDNGSTKPNGAFEEYMKMMDLELSKTCIGKSFEKEKDSNSVDVDKNTFTNMKHSLMNEVGGAGPAGNILRPLGYTNAINSIDSDDDDVD